MTKYRNMPKEDFKQAMTVGLGRAYIALRTGDKEAYREAVEYGCLTNFSYDTQANGTAEKYMYSLVKCYDDPLSFLAPLAEKFRCLDFDEAVDWDVLYYSRLLALFAKDGAAEARTVVCERYEEMLTRLKDPDRGVSEALDYDAEIYAILAMALLSIDGVDAYLKIATDLNDLHAQVGLPCRAFPWLISAINDLPKEPSFTAYVEEHAEEDLSLFLDDYALVYKDVYGLYTKEAAVREEDLEEEDDTPVREDVPPYEPFYDWAMRYEDPAVTEGCPALYDLIFSAHERSEAALKELDKYIDKPSEMPFKELKEYLEDYDLDVSEAAEEIFAHRSDEETLAYALKRLGARGPEWFTLTVLVNCYRPENEGVILYMMNKMRFEPEAKDDWHALLLGIVDAIYYLKVDLPQSILTFVYEHSLCRGCRENIFLTLYRRGWITPEMEEECAFDASPKIAIFAEEHGFRRADLA